MLSTLIRFAVYYLVTKQQLKMDKLQLTKQTFEGLKTVEAIVDFDAVKQNYIARYNAVSGTEQGAMRYEAEAAMFKQAALTNKKIDECDPFTKYAAFLELCISGQTLRDGISYMVPMGKVLVFMVGWRGRLEQIQEMPNVVFCHEPQIVYETDIFKYSKTENGIRIIEHTPNGKGERTETTPIKHVYFIVQMTFGPVVYHMEALDVYKIRKRSPSYKQYMKTLENKANVDAGKKYGDILIGHYKDRNQQWQTMDIEPPMWITDEQQAFKKTLVKRTYSAMPNKTPKQKQQDQAMAAAVAAAGKSPDDIDSDDVALNPLYSSAVPDENAGDGYTQFEEVKNDGNSASPSNDIDPSTLEESGSF